MNDRDRYYAAVHAMQSGVAFKMGVTTRETEPKHLRVGVNSAMVETSTLVKLLIAKGVFTEDEWFKVLADQMEAEAELYRKELEAHYGTPVTLG